MNSDTTRLKNVPTILHKKMEICLEMKLGKNVSAM